MKGFLFKLLLLILVVFTNFLNARAQNHLLQLHAHNDFNKNPPLKRALAYGIHSIEVDIYFFRNQLVVSHLPVALKKPTLESLYFEPLWQLYLKDFFSSFGTLRLMLDLKNASPELMNHLRLLLGRYIDMVRQPDGPVKVFLSGGALRNLLIHTDSGIVGLDDDFDIFLNRYKKPDHWSMQASISWGKFTDNYLKPVAPDYRDSLARSVARFFQDYNIPSRIYGAGNCRKRWDELASWGFTVINVDRYCKASSWLRKRNVQ